MPEFVSIMGEWHPKKEKIGLTNVSEKVIVHEGKKINPGEPFIYDGPDREAVKVLNELGVDTLGTNFKHNPEFLQSVRNLGFNSPEEYLKVVGFDEAKELERGMKLVHTEVSHSAPEQVDEIVEVAGGKDYSGNRSADVIGGFGEERQRTISEVKKVGRPKKA